MDDRQRILDRARQALGKGEDDDYVIAPTKHAQALEGTAPRLAAHLRRAELEIAAQRYERQDGEALEAQRTFKRSAELANWMVFATACVSALLLIFGTLLPDDTAGGLFVGLGVVGILTGGAATFFLQQLRAGKQLEKWMSRRAAAETSRLEYFKLATEAGSEAGGDLPLPLLQLEYFRRHQLDVQKNYYRRRAKDHERRANKLLILGSASVAGGAAATGLAGLLSGAVAAEWVSAAGLGAIASALAAFASTEEALGQDRRNAERYCRTFEALEGLGAKLGEVRQSAATGDRKPLERWVAAIHDQLSVEHRQWLEARENIQSSVAELDAALARSRANHPAQQGAPSGAGTANQ